MNDAVKRPRRVASMLTLGAVSAFGPLSMDLYLPALPRLTADFTTSAVLVQLTIGACLLGLALGQLLWGPLSDRFGRRRPLLAGVAGFALASLACALSPSIEILVSMRFVQGACGAAGIVVALAVVHDVFAGAEATRAYSTLATVAGVAPVVAPLAGGLLLTVVSWQGIFLVLAGIGVVLAAAAAIGVPESLPPGQRTHGGLSRDVASFAVALGNRRFVGYALAMGLASSVLFSYIQMSSLVLQDGYGLSAQAFALVFAVNGAGIFGVAFLNRRLARAARSEVLVLWSLSLSVLAAGGIVLAAVLGASALGLLLPLLIAVSMQGANSPNLTALALAPIQRGAGAAAAALGALSFALGAVIPTVAALFGVTATTMGATMVSSGVAALILCILIIRPLSPTRKRLSPHR